MKSKYTLVLLAAILLSWGYEYLNLERESDADYLCSEHDIHFADNSDMETHWVRFHVNAVSSEDYLNGEAVTTYDLSQIREELDKDMEWLKPKDTEEAATKAAKNEMYKEYCNNHNKYSKQSGNLSEFMYGVIYASENQPERFTVPKGGYGKGYLMFDHNNEETGLWLDKDEEDGSISDRGGNNTFNSHDQKIIKSIYNKFYKKLK